MNSNKIVDTVESLVAAVKDSKICLYGASNSGSVVLNGLKHLDCDFEVVCFVDTYNGGEHDGYRVAKFDDFIAEKIEYDAILIVSSYADEIEQLLIENGIEDYHIVDFYFYAHFCDVRWKMVSMSPAQQLNKIYQHAAYPFPEDAQLPQINQSVTAVSKADDGYIFSVIDFKRQVVDEWLVPYLSCKSAVDELKELVPRNRMPRTFRAKGQRRFPYTEHIAPILYVDQQNRPHVCHYSEDGFVFAPTWNGFLNYIIDTNRDEAVLFPADYDEAEPMMYSATNSLSPDQQWAYFVRWPLRYTIKNQLNGTDIVMCELGKVRLRDQHVEIIHELEFSEEIHQVSITPDERYAVFATFKQEMHIPYPDTRIEEDIEGYRKCHEGGIKLKSMATIDMQEKRHWYTEIPAPVPAHFEFDPVDPHVFYVSTHNCIFHGTAYVNAPILEGPGTLFKIRIHEGVTVIEGSYTDEIFYRIFQHMPFAYDGKTMVAVATTPNKLDILNAEDMTIWRRIELFEAELPDMSLTGNAQAPMDAHNYNCVNASKDGRYLIIGSLADFRVYDVKEELLLEGQLVLQPNGFDGRISMIGHTRTAGV